MDIAGYDELRREQAEKRASGELMGIGLSFFTERRRRRAAQAHGHPRPRHGRRRASCACTRPARPSLRLSVQTPGPGPRDDVRPDRRRGAGHPAGGHRGRPRRHRQHAVRPRHLRLALDAGVGRGRRRRRSRRVRDKARIIAAADAGVLARRPRVGAGPLVREGRPGAGQDDPGDRAGCRTATLELPEGVEGHLDADCVYDPPNLTYPFGAYICVVDVDPGTGQVKVRRFIAVDDCGPRINPMIVEGQVHGGLADGVGMALMQVIAFDEDGNCLGGSFMDYLLPTSMECPSWELGETVTPSPHHPLGVKGVGESATVGSPAAVVNAVHRRHPAVRRAPRRHAAHARRRCGGPCRATRSGPTWRSSERELDDHDAACTSGPSELRRRARPVRARPRGAAPSGRRRPSRATRRSCWPTARSWGSSAAVRGGDGAGAGAGRCSTPARPCCCASRPTPRSREQPGKLTRRAQPVPVRRDARDLPRTGRARAAGGRARRRPIAPALAAARRERSATTVAPWARGRDAADADAVVVASHGRDEEDGARRRARRRRALHRAGRQPQAGRGRARRRSTSTRRRAGPRAHARRARHRRAHARGGRAVDPRRDRRRRGRADGRPVDCRSPRRAAPSTPTAIDPVCGMTVAAVESSLHLDHDGDALLVLRPRLPATRSPPTRARTLTLVTRPRRRSSPTSTTLRAAARRGRLPRRPRAGDRAVLRGRGCRSRCCSKARPASARPRRPRRWPRVLDTPLIRLQCYEGIDAAEALYEWNYPRQLLGIRLAEARGATVDEDRPVRRATTSSTGRCCRRSSTPGRGPAVLLIDEVDRADDEFEAFLFELLAESTVTIPELGTLHADCPADRRADVEPHPRPARRAQAPLPLPLDRLPAAGAGRRASSAAACPRRRPTLAEQAAAAVQRAAHASTCRSRPASPRRSTGSRALDLLGIDRARRRRRRRDPRLGAQVPRGPRPRDRARASTGSPARADLPHLPFAGIGRKTGSETDFRPNAGEEATTAATARAAGRRCLRGRRSRGAGSRGTPMPTRWGRRNRPRS